MDITIRITNEEAERLYHSSMHCFYHEQSDRFYYVNKKDEKSDIMSTFDSSHTMHFCDDNIINAILLKNYFGAKGLNRVILWDECYPGYVVVTNQLWEDYMKKSYPTNKDEDDDEDVDVNVKCLDEELKIDI